MEEGQNAEEENVVEEFDELDLLEGHLKAEEAK